jgi:hypothetical protein
MKKTLAIVLSVIMLVCVLASCGGAKEAKIVGVYLSPATYAYSNMRPAYNFYLLNYAQSEITLYDDGTYMILVSDTTFSGVELSDSTNDATANERTNSMTKMFGTYTSKPNDLDEDLIDVTISAPTRVINKTDERTYLDTDNWTEDMGKSVAEKQLDESGNVTGTGDPLTAEQYLAQYAGTARTIQVNEKTDSMDFDNFGAKIGFQA